MFENTSLYLSTSHSSTRNTTLLHSQHTHTNTHTPLNSPPLLITPATTSDILFPLSEHDDWPAFLCLPSSAPPTAPSSPKELPSDTFTPLPLLHATIHALSSPPALSTAPSSPSELLPTRLLISAHPYSPQNTSQTAPASPCQVL